MCLLRVGFQRYSNYLNNLQYEEDLISELRPNVKKRETRREGSSIFYEMLAVRQE